MCVCLSIKGGEGFVANHEAESHLCLKLNTKSSIQEVEGVSIGEGFRMGGASLLGEGCKVGGG